MAIYHLHAKIIQRSKGANAVASAAYRHAAHYFDNRENRTWNYTRKKEVIHGELSVPNLPYAWLKELTEQDINKAVEHLWNTVEATEKRKDAQLAREIEFSLPIELTVPQNIALARQFIVEQFVSQGLIADWTVHNDKGNPHVHVMLTMRELTPQGFGKKRLDLNHKTFLHACRERWADYANAHLQLHHHDVVIDHRSYAAQGIDLIPTLHLGKAISDMESRGITTGRMQDAQIICRDNLTSVAHHPHRLLKKLETTAGVFSEKDIVQALGKYIRVGVKPQVGETSQLSALSPLTPDAIQALLHSIEQHESVFDEKALAKALSAWTDSAELFANAMSQVKQSEKLIYLGVGEDGKDRYTTHRMFKLENKLQEKADALRDKRHRKITTQKCQTLLARYEEQMGKPLTEEQREAVT